MPRRRSRAPARRVRTAFLEAQEHPRLTFGTLCADARLPRDPSHAPLVSIVFNVDKLGSPSISTSLTFERLEAPKAFYNFDLGLDDRRRRAPCSNATYNVDLFDAATIPRWLAQYRTLLTRRGGPDAFALAARRRIMPRTARAALGEAPVRRCDRAATLHEAFEAAVATHARRDRAELDARRSASR